MIGSVTTAMPAPLRRPAPRPVLGWLVALVLVLLAPGAAVAASGAPALPTSYPTAELARGFMLTVFGREGPATPDDGRRYVNKFVDPVGVTIVNRGGSADQTAEVGRFVALLARTVPNLRIAMAQDSRAARLTVYLVDRSAYRAEIAGRLPHGPKASFMEDNHCSAIMWSRTTGVLDRAAIFVLVDRGPRAFTSCLAEELTQSLGPANDNSSLVYSLYNDVNDVSTFGLFDWYILAALYDRHMLAGMTSAEAAAQLPAVIRGLAAKAAALRMRQGTLE